MPLRPELHKTTGAPASGSGRSALHSSIHPTIAPLTAAGGTCPRGSPRTPGGSPATSFNSGKSARLTGLTGTHLKSRRLKSSAAAAGTGRTAPASSIDPTIAPIPAAGGTTNTQAT